MTKLRKRENYKKVRSLYIESGLTQEELALRIGTTRNTLACWLTGRRTPADYVVVLIEQKVTDYLRGKKEYIDVLESKYDFMQEVYEILSEDSKKATEIIKAFEKLPTVSL